VIVSNLNIRCIAVVPPKADAPLTIDTDAPLPNTISLQQFKPVARWNPQAFDVGGRINLLQLPPCRTLHFLR
jgi:hypothetical protein